MNSALDAALWRAATALRDRLDAASARDLVLALVALRSLDNAADRPAEAAWNELASTDQLRRAVRAWRDARPALRAALPDPPQVEDERLVGALRAFDALDGGLGHDLLGELYMLLLGRFARTEGRRGGQYYTPPDVAALLVDLVSPAGPTIYDPACGSGGLLLAASASAPGSARLVGQELNPSTWRLAHLGAAVHGLTLDLGSAPADTLHDDLHPGLRADTLLANPPFNVIDWGAGQAPDDPRWAKVAPPSRSANLAWVLHALHHLAPDGHGAIVLAMGSLTDRRRDEVAARRAIIESGRLRAILALPDRLFWTTSIPACVWVLGPARSDTVLFVDARDLLPEPVRGTRALPPQARQELVALVRAHRAGEHVDRPGRARAVDIDQVTARRARLNPGEWIEPPKPPPSTPASGASPSELGELAALTERARALDHALLTALKALGDTGRP